MKKFVYLFAALFIGNLINAQTWNAVTSSNGNTNTNWTPGTVPGPGSTVTIPSITGPNSNPKLSSDISVSTLNMSAGSQLDINGFTIISINCDLNGATLNNISAVTDIVFSMNNGSSDFFRNNIINDNITINFNGLGTLYEGYQGVVLFTYIWIFPETFFLAWNNIDKTALSLFSICIC